MSSYIENSFCKKNPDEIFSLLATETDFVLPTLNSTLIKDECVYSCDTLFSPYGLFINLETLLAVGKDNLERDIAYTGGRLYLNIIEEKHLVKYIKEKRDSIEKLESIYQFNLYVAPVNTTISIASNVVSPEKVQMTTLMDIGIPEQLSRCLLSIITSHVSSSTIPVYPDQDLVVSKYAENLKQIPNPPTVPTSGWKCTHCGNNKNLWMNLTDGYIGCGRKIYLVPDSGCLTGEEGAAIRHFEENRENRPLAVKLGTLTCTSADVYSYMEDRMVIDPKLNEHLLHFNFDIQKAIKTEKSVLEMEHDYNKKFEFIKSTEENKKLYPVCRPCVVGLKNFGNTCYINSCLQFMFHVSALTQTLTKDLYQSLINEKTHPKKVYNDKFIQFVKLLIASNSDCYFKQRQQKALKISPDVWTAYETETPSVVLSPGLFRRAMCADHPEFRTSQQQDAEEFLRYFIEQLQTNAPLEYKDLLRSLFYFQIEDSLRRFDINAVKFSETEEFILSLTIPNNYTEPFLESLESNQQNDFDTKHSDFTLEGCIVEWMNEEIVDLLIEGESYISCTKSRKFKTFPPYLIVQLKRFCLTSNMKPTKLSFPIQVPDILDLTPYKATGLKPGETLWTEDLSLTPAQEAIKIELTSMGFNDMQIVNALHAFENNEQPMIPSDYVYWIIENPELASKPLPSKKRKVVQTQSENMQSMGFTELQIKAALIMHNENESAAINWLLTENPLDSELHKIIDKYDSDQTAESFNYAQTSGKYELIGCIMHLGKNTNTGHYVAFIREENKWMLFNDEKALITTEPKLDSGYLYLYRTVDL